MALRVERQTKQAYLIDVPPTAFLEDVVDSKVGVHSTTTDLFRIRGYYDGGYNWRVNELTGAVAGPSE